MKLSTVVFLLLLGFLSFNNVYASLLRRLKRSANPACTQRPVTGMCMALFINYYYNATSDTCNKFVYGGCGGNDNNFHTGEECVEACGGTIVESDRDTAPVFPGEASDYPGLFSHQDACEQPLDPGQCEDKKTRYYYDGSECKSFEYNGCWGNLNNFRTEQECLDRCGNKDSQE